MVVLKNIPIILFSIIIFGQAQAVEPRIKPDVQVKGNKGAEMRSNTDSNISLISAQESEGEKNYRWGVTRSSPLKVIQGWYEFDEEGIHSHGGEGRKIAETRPMQLTLRISKENGFLLLQRGYGWSSTIGDQKADITCKIEWPADAVLRTYYLSEPAGLTHRLQPVWKGELIQDAKVSKSVVYAVRVVEENVSDELFDAGDTSEPLRIGRKWAPRPDPAKKKYEGRTIEEWINQWDSRLYDDKRAATEALTRIGQPAVPAMIELMKEGGNRASRARVVLGKMGPQAEGALGWLIKTAGNKNPPTSQGWMSKTTYRSSVLYCLSLMTWASDRLMPVFKTIAEDPREDTRLRRMAISGLESIGNETMPILQRLADSEQGETRDHARRAMSELLDKEGQLSKEDYYTQLIEEDPFDPSVPKYLMSTKGIVNLGRPHPLTQKVKKLYRERLAGEPDPELAWQLATIIQNGLRGTQLEWAAPTDRSGSHWNREDPAESFATLAKVLELGFRNAQKSSELWRSFGIALAKLRLLQGDWNRMNSMLERLGEKTFPGKSRRWLSAPPVDWEKDLYLHWTIADESMRTGSCSLEFRIEKDGKGLKGAHFLVKRAPEPTNVFRTGIAADTLFFAPYPMEQFHGSFGYKAQDRPTTRYAVSDESGIVRFDKLPDIPIKIEVLVPTSNFTEAGSNWDIWMEVEPGKFKIAKIYGADAVNPRTEPAVVTLKQGQTVRYPKLVVRPAFGLNVKDWDRADKDNFVLSWQGIDPATQAKNVHYELEMHLSAPAENPSFVEDNRLKVRSAKYTLEVSRWPVGEKGVGGIRLQPGNIYMFEVRAVDASGTVVARWPKTRVWVPWGYRQTDPPFTEHDTYRNSPIHNEVWHRGSFGYGDGRKETLREKVARFLRESPDAFEYEYVRLGKAWLDWHDGDHKGARRQLEQLNKELPKGNVVRGTAIWLLQQMDEGKLSPKRLKFMPDRDTSSSKAILLLDRETEVQVGREAVDGLQVSITMEKTTFALDEPITVKWQIKNVSQEDKTIIWHKLHYSPVVFEIGKSGGKKYIREDSRRMFNSAIPEPPEKLILKPGETKEAIFDLRRFGLDSSAERGTYEVTGLYSPQKASRLADYWLKRPEFKDCFTGQISSAQLKIIITENVVWLQNQLRKGKFWNRLQAARRLAPIIGNEEVLIELEKIYPSENTRHMVWLVEHMAEFGDTSHVPEVLMMYETDGYAPYWDDYGADMLVFLLKWGQDRGVRRLSEYLEAHKETTKGTARHMTKRNFLRALTKGSYWYFDFEIGENALPLLILTLDEKTIEGSLTVKSGSEVKVRWCDSAALAIQKMLKHDWGFKLNLSEKERDEIISQMQAELAERAPDFELAGLSEKLKDKWLLDAKQSIDRHSGKFGIYFDIKYAGITRPPEMPEDIVISHRVKSLTMNDISIEMNDFGEECTIWSMGSTGGGFGQFFLPEQIEGLGRLKPGKYPVRLVLEGDIYKANASDKPLEHWQVKFQEEIELNDLIFEKGIPKAQAKVDYDVQVKANISQIGERGVGFSIWFDKLVWNLNETPTCLADLSHRGKSELHVMGSYMLEYDGVTYVVGQDSNNNWPNDYRRDADYRDITFELDSRWVNSQSGQELKLTSGLHRIRLSFNAKVLAGSEERFVRIVSDIAEFRILEHGKQITEKDALETAIGGMPGQKYTEEEVAAMHFEKYREKLSYDELAKFYCDKAQKTPDAELAECALAFEQDDINYLRLYIILGQAYHSQLKKYSPVLWSRQRRIVARVYLAGLNYALELDLPIHRPERIQVFKYYDNDKEIPISHLPTAAIKVAEDVDRVRDLIQQRQVLIGQIITIYAREPDAFKELRELAIEYISSEKVADQLVEAVKTYRENRSNPFEILNIGNNGEDKQFELVNTFQVHDSNGIRFEAGFVPDKKKIILGEHIFITFYVKNLGQKPYQFFVGGDNRGSVRHNNFRITAVDKNDQAVKDPYSYDNFGGHGNFINLGYGDIYAERLYLGHWCAFEKPGIYTVTCKRILDTHDAGEYPKVPVTISFELNIIPSDRDKIRQLIERLGEQINAGGEGAVREASLALSVINDESVIPHLVSIMKSKADWRSKNPAIDGLKQFSTMDSIEGLISGLKDNDVVVRNHAAQAIADMEMNDYVCEVLLKELESKDLSVRELAVRALGEIGGEKAFEVLKASLVNQDMGVRYIAAEAIGRLGDPRGIEVLEDPVKDEDFELRLAATRGMISLKQPVKSQWLTPVIKGAANVNDQKFHEAIRLLRLYGGQEAAPGLVSCIKFDDPSTKSRYNFYLILAIEACKDGPNTTTPF